MSREYSGPPSQRLRSSLSLASGLRETSAEERRPRKDDETFTSGFRLGVYDTSLRLVLDPVVLVYAGYIGGSNLDAGNGIAVDSTGHAYVTGYTSSSQSSFPGTGGRDLTFGGGSGDAFVVKLAEVQVPSLTLGLN